MPKSTAVVLSVSSNDLCDATRTAESVAMDLHSQHLGCGVPKFIICQVLQRQSRSHFRGIKLDQYSDAVNRVDDLLKALWTGRVGFWTHRHGALGSQWSPTYLLTYLPPRTWTTSQWARPKSLLQQHSSKSVQDSESEAFVTLTQKGLNTLRQSSLEHGDEILYDYFAEYYDKHCWSYNKN